MFPSLLKLRPISLLRGTLFTMTLSKVKLRGSNAVENSRITETVPSLFILAEVLVSMKGPLKTVFLIPLNEGEECAERQKTKRNKLIKHFLINLIIP